MNYSDSINSCALFDGICADETAKLLDCLSVTQKSYRKSEYLIREGEAVGQIGIILHGSITAVRESYDGEVSVISVINSGGIFGDALSADGRRVSPASVYATAETVVLYIPFDRIMNGCGNACPSHARLRQNLIHIIAEKYWALHQKIAYLSIKSLRRRILAYLHDCRGSNRGVFTIPLDRAAMSGYLGADRAALCRELSRLKAEGIIDYHKQTFKINEE